MCEGGGGVKIILIGLQTSSAVLERERDENGQRGMEVNPVGGLRQQEKKKRKKEKKKSDGASGPRAMTVYREPDGMHQDCFTDYYISIIF